MKTLLFCCAILFFSYGASGQYLSTSYEEVPYSGVFQVGYPGENAYAVVDLTEVDSDEFLDLVSAQNKSENYPSAHWEYVGLARNNTQGSPSFDWENTYSFVSRNPLIGYARDAAFGQLRQEQKKDLAIARSDSVQIHRNQDGVIESDVWQSLAGGATSIGWGPINWQDASEDLVVSSGSQIKVYRNSNADTLISSPLLTISASAGKIVVAQMNQTIHAPQNPYDRSDIVAFDGKEISIYYNSNNNQFDTLQVVSGNDNINDIAVGDINNDGWNDLVVGYFASTPELEVYLNDGHGRLETSPVFTFEAPCCYTGVLVAVADFGGPGTDSTRNDGWNDILVGSYGGKIGILINTGSSPFFEEDFAQEQYIGAYGYEWLKQLRVADVQNTGGQSVIVSIAGGGYFPNEWTPGRVHLFKHAGNPAPAPPKSVTIGATPPNQYGYSYPLIRWAKNTERDLAGYQLWRMTTGANCGTSNWSIIADNLPAAQTEYTDLSIGTVMPGGDCTARYTLKAKDNANNYSDTSRNVQINYASYIWKTGDQKGNRPTSYALHAAYPNPFNPSTQIKFDLPEDSHVSLSVFDVLGRKVAQVVSDNYVAGYHSVSWDASAVASGVYFARFTAMDAHGNAKFARVSKLLLTK